MCLGRDETATVFSLWKPQFGLKNSSNWGLPTEATRHFDRPRRLAPEEHQRLLAPASSPFFFGGSQQWEIVLRPTPGVIGRIR